MACIKKRREEQNREPNILKDETEQERNDRELDNSHDIINNQVQVLNNVNQILNSDVTQDITKEIIEKEKVEDDVGEINIFDNEDNEIGEEDSKNKNKFKCDHENCTFETSKESGLAIHKGKIHKQ